jgi:hypothetical protein
MEKRAELTSKQIITIVILIISAGVIFIFWFFLNPSGQISKSACLNSITLRGGIPLKYFKDIVVIKCKTQKVCISAGGECDVQGKDVLKVTANDEGKVREAIAGLISDCWTMTGKGESKYGDDNECGMCSIIYFDKEIQNKIGVSTSSGRRIIKLNYNMISDIINHVWYNYEKDGYRFWLDKPMAIVSFIEESGDMKSWVAVTEYSDSGLSPVWEGKDTSGNDASRSCENWIF